jgi:hypothetical protein
VFAALLGILIGAALAIGPLAMYKADASILSERVVTAADKILTGIVDKLPYAKDNPKVVIVISVVLAVATPGFVALVLVAAANAAVAVKRTVSGGMVLLAGLSFFVLPASSAIILVVAALVVSGVLIAPGVLIARVVLWSIATLIAFDHIHALWSGQAPAIAAGADTLVALTGFSTAEFWRFGLIVVGVAPFPIAAASALKS